MIAAIRHLALLRAMRRQARRRAAPQPVAAADETTTIRPQDVEMAWRIQKGMMLYRLRFLGHKLFLSGRPQATRLASL